ncbi:MAG: hypothetical protein ACRCYO_17405 [Bacteroidia bacterium]
MYVLLPIVLAIWGTIGWKIYAGLQEKTETKQTPQTGAMLPKNELQAESLSLVANYRDPFLEGAVSQQQTNTIQTPKVNQPAVQTPKPQPIVETPQQWPQITYNGLIKRNGEEKVVGFLTVDGQSHFVKPGDKAGSVNIVKLWKDSIQVSWNKLQRVVRK